MDRRDDFLALGAAGNDHCLLVDVRRWDELGRPDIRSPLVDDVGEELDGRCVALGRLSTDERSRLARYMGKSIGTYDDDRVSWQDPRTGVFLKEVQRQVANAPRGVFLWNLEPHDDVRNLPNGFEPPIYDLYSVAAGFKPNMILESLGFDARTRVVFFDYSARALEVKRLLLEEWDGRDFPAFLPPSSGTCRLIPRTTTCGTAPRRRHSTPRAAERAWERELEAWGGEREFEEHWSRYRRLRHEFVHCDVLGDVAGLLALVEPERSAVIWWSNAFFTVWGNWLFDARRPKAPLRAVDRRSGTAESRPLPVRVRLFQQQRQRRSGGRVSGRAPRSCLRRARPAGSECLRDPLLGRSEP